MKQQPKQTKKPATKTPAHKPIAETYSLNKLLPYIGGILALTFVCFIPVFQNQLIFWDDPEYTYNNPFIKAIDLKSIFGGFYFGNYHPLTMLSYELEYHFFGINPKVFHLDNLILHLLNTALVFMFVYYLLLLQRAKNASFKLSGNALLVIPCITSILFAIHPMHVESVAWASERKDVLYSFFFLLSMIGYIFYLKENLGMKYILISFLCFLLSCFSKGQAVVLPIALLCIDYLIKRKINSRMIVEKIPFLILSLIFGIVAIKAQIQESAINSDYLTGAKIIFTGTYGLTMYLLKVILPINLSGAHPYPGVETGGFSPLIYITPFVLLALIYLIFRSIKRNRYVAFGAMFFLVCIIMVLKLIPLGDTIISERYTYLPYIGIFFMFGNYYNSILEKHKQLKTLLLASLGVLIIAFSITTFERCYVWKDTNSFWSDVAAKYPHYWRAPNNIAQGFIQEKKYDSAVAYFTKAIECDEKCPPVPYMWRGQIYLDNMKKNDLAIADFKKVIDFPNKMDPTQLEGRVDLGLAYYRNGQYDDAIKTYNEVLQRDPNNAKTYQLMALVYSQKKEYQTALDDYAKAIQLNPTKDQMIETLINRGSMYTDVLGRYADALADFKQVLQLDPENKDATLNTGITYYKMGQWDNAINVFNVGLQKDANNAKIIYLKALCYGGKQDYANALKDMNQAKNMGMTIDENQVKIWEAQLGKRK